MLMAPVRSLIILLHICTHAMLALFWTEPNMMNTEKDWMHKRKVLTVKQQVWPGYGDLAQISYFTTL